MNLKDLDNKRILIIGAGREGLATLKYLKNINRNIDISISDKEKKEIPSDINFFWGKDYLKDIKKYDLIIVSPGVPPKEFESLIDKKQKITTPTQIFFDECKGKIVGITGTKGKSTTASLIYSILKDNKKVSLVGNIGKPALEALEENSEDNIYIFELSSYQLHYLNSSPDIAVLLNIFPEHNDWHGSFSNYYNSKKNIAKYQDKNDYLIFNNENKIIRRIVKNCKANKIIIENNKLVDKVYEKSNLISPSYKLNIAAAIAVSKIFNLSDEQIIKGIESFSPLEHRLEFVGKFKGILFYNDSISTIPQTTILAINSFDNIGTIILGGFDRGNIKYNKLIKLILKKNIKNIVLFPTTGEKIFNKIKRKDRNRLNILFTSSIKEAVSFAYENTEKGSVCLFSPAAASYNLFKNFEERGNLFKKNVLEYEK